jgi:aminoglycoside phosphotransferase family enzyme/predicted kinase
MADGSENLPLLIRRMLEADFYPHPTLDPIALIQTHISYVLLTGDFAYKVKKPVDLGFVDFSTLELRGHFCHEEVRLNSRGAPGVYLGVETIGQAGGEFRLSQDGAVAEYAVKMQQLPQEDLFGNMLAAGRLEARHIEALARTVAEYHRGSPTNDRIAQFGTPDRIRKIIEDNYAATRRFIGGPQTAEQFSRTKAFTERFFSESRSALEHRPAGSFIRECHGDLHLGNVCLRGDEVLLFDCIEFNESFRCIDVIQDAAFAAMDLEASGRSDFATQFANAYAERTGDWEGLQLLRLYLCRHAYVRGKVTALLLDEPEIAPEAKKKASATAAKYFHLAWQYSEPQRGRLILVAGLSGSGKSTVARELTLRLGAIHIRSDAVRKHLAGVVLERKGDESIYTPAMTDRTYGRLLELGMMLARHGFAVILDAKFDRRQFRRAAIDRARSAGLPVSILHCTAPVSVMRDRLTTRQGDVSDAGPEILERQQGEFETFDDTERPCVIEVDTTKPLGTLLQ